MDKKEEYDKESVFYCTNCLSLAIKKYDQLTDYCGQCGSTNTSKTTIGLWEDSYEAAYGKKYVKH